MSCELIHHAIKHTTGRVASPPGRWGKIINYNHYNPFLTFDHYIKRYQ